MLDNGEFFFSTRTHFFLPTNVTQSFFFFLILLRRVITDPPATHDN